MKCYSEEIYLKHKDLRIERKRLEKIYIIFNRLYFREEML